MLQPGRQYTNGSGYRYGFNGKENDNDVKGEGNQQDYGMRIYDPRLGRFLSVDPLSNSFPFYSPFEYAGNTPIQAIDLDGLEDYVVVKEKYKSGKTKKITIQFTKDKSNNLVNVHFREALGNNPDGSQKLGSYLTGTKVLRIIRDGYGKERLGNLDDELNKEELAVVNNHTQNDKPPRPSDNQWTIEIGRTLYLSETERNTNLMQDKTASQTFLLIENTELNQKFSTTGLYIGATPILPGTDLQGNGNIKNGTIDWAFPENQKIKSLISRINDDGGIKSISITVSLNISNCTDAEYQIFKIGVESIGAQLKTEFSKTGINSNNISVKTEALRDKQGTEQGTRITLKR
jgi:RHS repeat-associated protein